MIWHAAAQPCIACRGGLLLRWVLVLPVSLWMWYVLGRYSSLSCAWTPRSTLAVAHCLAVRASVAVGYSRRARGSAPAGPLFGDRVSVAHDTHTQVHRSFPKEKDPELTHRAFGSSASCMLNQWMLNPVAYI